MENKQLLIREATKSDLPIILKLIYLKAQFDGCPESVEATLQKLEDTLFCNNPIEFILLAEIDREIIGFASYHYIYSTFLAQTCLWLNDLYIKPERRGKGIGTALIERLCQIAQENNCGRIDWTVSINNPKGIKFYERIGATIIQKVRLCRLDKNAIASRDRIC
ncbi:GNAT family N-acetyltransferase [Hydrococcus rivularis NIES-593]|uniref:GNAT family N-acetyltransferase n=1 Tax=Hydrococcus rivularis NIES-593 TaxID=1921803 RepID=A0A1U7H777_9CYAN|nr:GNAT family N-acetyltransferase [Hydrococcus rivularis]OKH17950.1 GNAT family N-acetyltransferase [Hydrococcus rivularis NIES-593]